MQKMWFCPRLEYICPAKGKKCHKCLEYNHFAKMSKSISDSKSKKGVHGVEKDNSTCCKEEEEEPTSDDDFMFIGCVGNTIDSVDPTHEWYKTLTIKDKLVQFQSDTGAKCCMISTKIYKSVSSVPKLRKSDTSLKSYSGHPIVV